MATAVQEDNRVRRARRELPPSARRIDEALELKWGLPPYRNPLVAKRGGQRALRMGLRRRDEE